MKIEMEKVRKVLMILGYSDAEAGVQLDKLGNVLMMEIAAEALLKKGYESKSDIPNKEEIADFLQEHYSEEEIKELIGDVSNNVVGGYFAEIMKHISDEKKVLIKKMLDFEG